MARKRVNESTRVEEDFARWEHDKGIVCSNEGCDGEAVFAVKFHATGHYHGFGWRCQRCMYAMQNANNDIINKAGYVICAVCWSRFESLSDFMYSEKL